MKVTLRVWRQKNSNTPGRMESYELEGVDSDMSFLEMLDLLNEQLDLLSEGVHDAQQRAEELGAEQILASHTFVQQKFAQNKTTELKL